MDTGTKITLAFLGGAVAGAAALALLNRGRLDFGHLKPFATDLMNKGMDLKESLMARFDAVKEEMADLVAEANAHAEAQAKPANTQEEPGKA